MKIHLVPLRIKNLKELSEWLKTIKFNLPKNFSGQSTELKDVIGVRANCKLSKIREFSYHGPRWTTYTGISIYYNF